MTVNLNWRAVKLTETVTGESKRVEAGAEVVVVVVVVVVVAVVVVM